MPVPALGSPVLRGKLVYHYADGEDVIEGGQAYYAKPGHTPEIFAGTEVVEFHPTDELAKTMGGRGAEPGSHGLNRRNERGATTAAPRSAATETSHPSRHAATVCGLPSADAPL